MKAFLWSNVFTLIPLFSYMAQAGIDWQEHRAGFALMFLAYATANVGIIITRMWPHLFWPAV